MGMLIAVIKIVGRVFGADAASGVADVARDGFGALQLSG